MTMLHQPYAETPFRQFSNELIGSLINATLWQPPKQANPFGLRPAARFASHSNSEMPVDEEVIYHLLRYWAWHVALSEDVVTEWASSWLEQGLTRLPRSAFRCDWTQWDALLTRWLKEQYLVFAHGEWDVTALTDTQWAQLWQQMGIAILTAQSPPQTLHDIERHMTELAGTLDRTWDTLGRIWDVMTQFAQSMEIPLQNVPDWAMGGGWSSPEQGPGEPVGWDAPLQAIGQFLERPLDTDNVRNWIAREWSVLRDSWATNVQGMRERPLWTFRFWFPMTNRQMTPPNRAALSENTDLVGLTEADAQRLNNAHGVGPRPEHHVGDMVVQIDVKGPYLEAARDRARSVLGEVQSFLRVADPSSQWAVGPFVYHEVFSGPTHFDLTGFDNLMAMRRDNHQLAPPVDPDKVAQFFGWIAHLKTQSQSLAGALTVAMQWQGLAWDQDNPENAFLCDWIALERLGEGSYHFEQLIPALGALYWHPGWYPEDTAAIAELYAAEQDRLAKLVHALKKIRNNDVAHRGVFRHKVDERYAAWMLTHLVNDVKQLYIAFINQGKFQTFEELRHEYGIVYEANEPPTIKG